MQGKAGKKQAQSAKIKKPYLKGRAFSALAIKRGLSVLAYIAISAVFFLFLGQMLVLDIAWLRILINIGVLLGFAALLYTNGVNQGESDVSFAEIALARQQEGREIPKSDLDRCFHPLKGYVTVFFGALPIVIVCLVYALMATKETYTLGALPSWVSGYQSRLDIGLALQYYGEHAAFGLADTLRIITRLLIFPFVNLVGQGNPDGLLLVERLSPLLVLIAPFFYGVGYQRGESYRALVHGGIASNAKKRARKQRKKQATRTSEPKRLV